MRYFILSAFCLFASTATYAEPPLPTQLRDTPATSPASFQSEYTIFRNGTKVGKGQRTLHASSDGRWYFCSESRLSWFILSDYRKEQSWLRIKDGVVQPIEYQYDRTGTGPDRFSHVIFDHQKKSLQELKKSYPLKVDWSEDLLDHLSYQLQLRMDVKQGKTEMDYALLYKGKRKEYHFKVIAEEKIKLPIGSINTVKIKMVRKAGSSRETLVWLSKDHDYALARLWQARDGKEQADLQLSGLKPLSD